MGHQLKRARIVYYSAAVVCGCLLMATLVLLRAALVLTRSVLSLLFIYSVSLLWGWFPAGKTHGEESTPASADLRHRGYH